MPFTIRPSFDSLSIVSRISIVTLFRGTANGEC